MTVDLRPLRAPWLPRSALGAGQRSLVRNGYSLVANSVLSAGLGLTYWVLAARLYPTANVGRDAALISCMVALSSVAQLNLAVALPRVLPAAPSHARALVLAAYAVTLGAGVAVSSAFVLTVPHLPGQRGFLEHGASVVFVAGTALWGIFSLQDAVLTGMRRTGWVPVDNALFGMLKIGAVAGLAGVLALHGVFYSWTAAALLPLAPVNWLLFRRILPAQPSSSPAVLLQVLRSGGFLRYLSLDYAASLLRLAYITLLPLFVVSRLGASGNAYFYIGFTIALALDSASLALSTSLTVEAAHDERSLAMLARLAVHRVSLLVGPASLVVLLAAPLVLAPFGQDYSRHGVGVLRLLVCATFPKAALDIRMAIARVQRRGGAVLRVQAALLLSGLVLTPVLAQRYGVQGVAAAWLASHCIVALAVTPRLVHALRSTARTPAATPDGLPPAASPSPRRLARAAHRTAGVTVPHAAALLVAGVAAVAATPLPAGVRVLLTLVSLLLAPAAATVTVLATRGTASAVGSGLAASLSTWLIGATAMAATGIWLPGLLYGAVLTASLSVLVVQGARPGAPRWPRARRPPGSAVLAVGVVAAAVGLWCAALPHVHLPGGSVTGLLPSLPWTFWLALTLLDLGFVAELSRRARPRVLGLYTVTLLVLVHALPALVYDEPRYPWVYKHLGVSAAIAAHGALDRSADVFSNWPGLFAAGALLGALAGASLLGSVAWAEVLFDAASVVAVVFLLTRLVPGRPRVVWLATWLFVALNWVGQDYYSPQAVSYVLVLLTLALVVQDQPGRNGPVRPAAAVLLRLRHPRAFVRSPQPGRPGAPRGAGRQRWLLLALLVAVAVSHQLSPVMLVLSLGSFVVLGVAGSWRTLLAAVVLTGAWWTTAVAYLARQPGLLDLSLRPFANIAGKSSGPGGSASAAHVGQVAVAMTLGALLLAGAGVVRRWRHGRLDVAALALVGTPVLLVAGSSYGGEAPYRVYLFALPGLALLGAFALLPPHAATTTWLRARTVLLLATVTCSLVAGLAVVGFGREQVNHTRRGEVAAADFFYATAPAGSLLVSAAPTFPLRLAADYARYATPGQLTDPDLLQLDRLLGHSLTASDVEVIADTYHGAFPSATGVYIALSVTMAAFVDTYGGMPRGSVARLDQLLSASPRFAEVLRNRDAVLYRQRY